MKDSLDILRTDYGTSEFIEHHGVKGMKWGVRREDKSMGTPTKSVSNNHGLEGRKKKVTAGNGNGVHKRGEGQHYVNAYQEAGVGPYDDYHNAVNVYGDIGAFSLGFAPVTTQLGKALKTEMLKEMMKTEEYRNIKRLTEEFNKLASSRNKTWNQGNSSATANFEEKASSLIRAINSNLTALDGKYRDKSKMVKQTVDKTYSPSKDILDFLFPGKVQGVSGALKIDKNSGRVSKGWKAAPTNPNNKVSWNKKTSK